MSTTRESSFPKEIKVNRADGYFDSNTEEFWNLAQVDSTEIVRKIDQLLDRASWGNDSPDHHTWKTDTEFIDHDASLSVNKLNGNIEEFSFRADLREKDLKFLMEMIALCVQYDFVLMDIKGKLAIPEWDQVKGLIIESNAHRFLLDPEKFLADLVSGKTKTE